MSLLTLRPEKPGWGFMDVNISFPALETLAGIARDFLGIWIEPSKIRRLADAQAYSIQQLSKTITSARFEGVDIKYDKDGVVLVPASEVEALAQTLPERAIKGQSISLLREQLNRERIIGYAAQVLSKEDESNGNKAPKDDPSPKAPDVDWLHAFFESARFANREEMQKLWGQILAGEIKDPESYSPRLFISLKHISKRDAETLQKVFKYAVSGLFIPEYFVDRLTYEEWSLADELGFIKTQSIYQTRNFRKKALLHRKGKGISVEVHNLLELDTIELTSIGKQLDPLVDASLSENEWRSLALHLLPDVRSVQFIENLTFGEKRYYGQKTWRLGEQ